MPQATDRLIALIDELHCRGPLPPSPPAAHESRQIFYQSLTHLFVQRLRPCCSCAAATGSATVNTFIPLLSPETELPPHDKLFFLTDINKKKKKLFSYFAPSANPTPHCTTFLMRLQPHKHIKRPQPGTSIMCFSPHVFVPLSAGGAMGETRNRVDLSV